MTAAPDVVIAAARAWLGTPYVHQASVLGAGCDCLGLARGIWRDLYGPEPVTPPAYTRDWGEAGGEEVLADAARRFLLEIPIAEAGPGALILFRMARNAPAKHCGIRSKTGLNCRSVSLVVAWFGTEARALTCRFIPHIPTKAHIYKAIRVILSRLEWRGAAHGCGASRGQQTAPQTAPATAA